MTSLQSRVSILPIELATAGKLKLSNYNCFTYVDDNIIQVSLLKIIECSGPR